MYIFDFLGCLLLQLIHRLRVVVQSTKIVCAHTFWSTITHFFPLLLTHFGIIWLACLSVFRVIVLCVFVYLRPCSVFSIICYSCPVCSVLGSSVFVCLHPVCSACLVFIHVTPYCIVASLEGQYYLVSCQTECFLGNIFNVAVCCIACDSINRQ